MRRILEDLYHGNLTASGQTFRRGTKYARALARLAETEDALGRKLAPEDHPLLAEYAMASAGLTSVSLEEAYIEGFRTGARIMLAVLQEDKPQESKDEDKTRAIAAGALNDAEQPFCFSLPHPHELPDTSSHPLPSRCFPDSERL